MKFQHLLRGVEGGLEDRCWALGKDRVSMQRALRDPSDWRKSASVGAGVGWKGEEGETFQSSDFLFCLLLSLSCPPSVSPLLFLCPVRPWSLSPLTPLSWQLRERRQPEAPLVAPDAPVGWGGSCPRSRPPEGQSQQGVEKPVNPGPGQPVGLSSCLETLTRTGNRLPGP